MIEICQKKRRVEQNSENVYAIINKIRKTTYFPQ